MTTYRDWKEAVNELTIEQIESLIKSTETLLDWEMFRKAYKEFGISDVRDILENQLKIKKLEQIEKKMLFIEKSYSTHGDWIKRLGQWHIYPNKKPEDQQYATTLCGSPMLGNNYAGSIPIKDRIVCKQCYNILRMEKRNLKQ